MMFLQPEVSDLELIEDIKAQRREYEEQDEPDVDLSSQRKETATPSNIEPELDMQPKQDAVKGSMISVQTRKIRLLPSKMMKYTSTSHSATPDPGSRSLTPTDCDELSISSQKQNNNPFEMSAKNDKFRSAVTKVVAVKSFKPRLALLPR